MKTKTDVEWPALPQNTTQNVSISCCSTLLYAEDRLRTLNCELQPTGMRQWQWRHAVCPLETSRDQKKRRQTLTFTIAYEFVLTTISTSLLQYTTNWWNQEYGMLGWSVVCLVPAQTLCDFRPISTYVEFTAPFRYHGNNELALHTARQSWGFCGRIRRTTVYGPTFRPHRFAEVWPTRASLLLYDAGYCPAVERRVETSTGPNSTSQFCLARLQTAHTRNNNTYQLHLSRHS